MGLDRAPIEFQTFYFSHVWLDPPNTRCHNLYCQFHMHPVVITQIVSFISVLDIQLVLREVEETSLLSESERMLSKTILVPGANHAQVNIGIHATWL